jgi:hypothetical protein
MALEVFPYIKMHDVIAQDDQLFGVCATGIELRPTTDMSCRQENLANKIKQGRNQAKHGCNK